MKKDAAVLNALKSGDRVRLKDTVRMGTVVTFAEASASPGFHVLVEWDGGGSVPSAVNVVELAYVRPPPCSSRRHTRSPRIRSGPVEPVGPITP